MFQLQIFDNGLYSFDLDADSIPAIGDTVDGDLKVLAIELINEDVYRVDIEYIV